MAVAGDPVIAFGGQRVKTLLNKIEAAMRQRRFSQRPIGPLGSLLSLTHDKWAVAVETAIGKCFNDFLVANMSDLEVLKVRHMLKMAVAPIVRVLVMLAPHLCQACYQESSPSLLATLRVRGVCAQRVLCGAGPYAAGWDSQKLVPYRPHRHLRPAKAQPGQQAAVTSRRDHNDASAPAAH